MRSHPTSRRQLERLRLTSRTTLLICTAALPQFGNLRVTKEELDDWYAWFYGEDIAGRKPPERHHLAVRRAQYMAQDSRDGAPGHHSLRSPQEHQGRLPLLAYEHLNRAPQERRPRCGRLSGRSPRRGEKDPGPRGRPGPSRRARAARGSPPTPPRPHGRTTGLSRIPNKWRTAEIITFTTSVRDHAADPTTARSGRMGGCVMPPHRSMCHRHAHTFPSHRRPLRVP